MADDQEERRGRGPFPPTTDADADANTDASSYYSGSDTESNYADAHEAPLDGPSAPEPEPPVALSEEERARRTEAAAALKAEGNQLFGHGDWEAAYEKYQEAVRVSPPDNKDIAVFKGNAAACRLKQELYEEVVKLCTEALAVDSTYLKALQRRALAHEKLTGLEHLSGALEDYKRIVELEPSNGAAKAKIRELEPLVEQERQKQMQEMLGKMKELGNMFLGKFGLSTDNFKMEKDPNTGSYSIQFVK